MNHTVITRSGKETCELGERLGRLIQGGIAISLTGDLGAGKTTFVQGLAKGLGVPDAYYVTSPTYTIINEYPGRVDLCHMDLYRLGSSDELDYIGFDEIVDSDRVIIIEWPDIIDPGLINFTLDIILAIDEQFNRKISFIASGLGAVKVLRNLFV
ncbi:MAG: tRNA (adenosine(37)-N6)-threonylcarbamoyltransferase complex ATPase subunit type 1 TsaE [Desulfobacterium sp.]|nr:tRNA (adenosine(37)-N6)-threonylcarbamoyltransferase complex ATPase subunit type 1 TsaE [Desulfobacterium sp.]